MELRRCAPCAVMSLGAAVALWGSTRPWLASGTAERSSYELLGLVERLGHSSSGPLAWAVTLWPVMPLLLVTATVAAWWGRVVVGSVTGVVGGLHAAVVALGVSTAPSDGLIRSLPGTTVTLVGAAVFLVGVSGVGVSGAVAGARVAART